MCVQRGREERGDPTSGVRLRSSSTVFRVLGDSVSLLRSPPALSAPAAPRIFTLPGRTFTLLAASCPAGVSSRRGCGCECVNQRLAVKLRTGFPLFACPRPLVCMITFSRDPATWLGHLPCLLPTLLEKGVCVSLRTLNEAAEPGNFFGTSRLCAS